MAAPIPPLLGSPYIRAIAMCEFDADVGQVLRTCVPEGALTEEEGRKLAWLSLPDANASWSADAVYCFRLRTDALPLLSASALDHAFLFGFALFQQIRDPSVRRGFRQQSLVVVSEVPYVALLKHVARLVGLRYFELEVGRPGWVQGGGGRAGAGKRHARRCCTQRTPKCARGPPPPPARWCS